VRLFAAETQSGQTDRAALARCIASLDAGDLLLVTKLYWLAIRRPDFGIALGVD
jgi:hypothetical protein